MKATCPECNSELIGYRLIKYDGDLMEEECNIIVENGDCLRIWKPLNALCHNKAFDVYCVNEKCHYRIMDTMDILSANKLAILDIYGNIHYVMGRA